MAGFSSDAWLQGHVMAETQIKLSSQHYMDQLPRQEEEEPEYEEAAGPLTVNWQDEEGRDTVIIQGKCLHRCLQAFAQLPQLTRGFPPAATAA